MTAVGDYAIVALGSNLGDSPTILKEAVDALKRLACGPVLEAPIYRSAPVDCPPGSSDFLNTMVAFIPDADETAYSLLAKLQSIERVAGRMPKRVLNEARPLDLDIIAFKDEGVNEADLIVPHPRALERRFVLQPLADILPDLILPGMSATVREALERLPGTPLDALPPDSLSRSRGECQGEG